jgi:hypothetical protein
MKQQTQLLKKKNEQLKVFLGLFIILFFCVSFLFVLQKKVCHEDFIYFQSKINAIEISSQTTCNIIEMQNNLTWSCKVVDNGDGFK